MPLISKVYFKDSNAIEAHGFDAVHITDDTLWLGETKFYNNGEGGIKALVGDLNNHFKHEYLKEQFVIINKALMHKNPIREDWIRRIQNANRLEDIFQFIKIPLLCIYENEIATQILDVLNEDGFAETVYLTHVNEMKSFFDANNSFPNKNRVQILLILLPVQSKDRIIAEMLKRIYNMQNI